MGLGNPAPSLQQQIIVPIPAVLLYGAGSIPPIHPSGPGGVNAVTGITEARVRVPLLQRVSKNTEVSQGAGEHRYGRSPVGEVNQVALGRQKIDREIFESRTLVGQE